MLYNLYKKLHARWMSFKWKHWTRHQAWEIVKNPNPEDDYNDLIFMHFEAASRNDMLLAAQLEMLLNDIGCEVEFVGWDTDD